MKPLAVMLTAAALAALAAGVATAAWHAAVPVAAPSPPLQVAATHDAAARLPVLGAMPSLDGATGWLQSPPLSSPGLRGRVVLVDFWTLGCINCQRALPAVRAWARRFRGEGLVVIGVHTPEFPAERDRAGVERALRRLDLDFPIAIDNDHAIWKAWSTRAWPSLWLVDANGRLRWHHVGEGAEAQTERAIRALLDEARAARAGR